MQYSLVSMVTDIPANGQLHEIMAVSYTVHNRTSQVQEVESKMGQSEAFMYSGNRQVLYTVHKGLTDRYTRS